MNAITPDKARSDPVGPPTPKAGLGRGKARHTTQGRDRGALEERTAPLLSSNDSLRNLSGVAKGWSMPSSTWEFHLREDVMDDIEAIRRLKAQYFRTMDTKDWEGMRQVFTDDVTVDTRATGGKRRDPAHFRDRL